MKHTLSIAALLHGHLENGILRRFAARAPVGSERLEIHASVAVDAPKICCDILVPGPPSGKACIVVVEGAQTIKTVSLRKRLGPTVVGVEELARDTCATSTLGPWNDRGLVLRRISPVGLYFED